MAGRYVPPALRKQQIKSQSDDCSQVIAPQAKPLNPRGLKGLQRQSNSQLFYHYQDEIFDHLGGGTSTISAIPVRLGCIGVVLLFPRGHPDWPPTILVKSNIHLLRGHINASSDQTSQSSTASPEPPLSPNNQNLLFPVFSCSGRGRQGRFSFCGRHVVTRIQYLEAGSSEQEAELVAKYAHMDRAGSTIERSAPYWIATFERQWAKVDLAQVPIELGSPMEKPAVPGSNNRRISVSS